MAYDYALVHVKFTIPCAGLLTLISYPFLTRRHRYQTAIIIAIAVISTIPWDSYLVRHNVWTYPNDAVIGPTFWSIPAEELFFFVIQTYNTSLLYQLLNKPLLHAEYLLPSSRLATRLHKSIQIAILGLALAGFWLISHGEQGTYMGLILSWACPFALLTWSLGGLFMTTLPWTSTVIPIALPTLYLWVVDEMALRRGTWVIESGTKLGVTVWGGLEVEEAVFFLATNVLIVFGLGAFDYALAIVDAFPDAFESSYECVSPSMLTQALLMTWSEERKNRIRGIQEAVRRLCRKSRSFYLASSTFSGRLRINLVLLLVLPFAAYALLVAMYRCELITDGSYSYCRMADDLIDDAPRGDTSFWIDRLSGHLDCVYKPPKSVTPHIHAEIVQKYINKEFSMSDRSALSILPTSLLPPEPLYLLLEGFKTDATFWALEKEPRFPISDEECLQQYGSHVAGTVGELCLSLIAHHSSEPLDPAHREEVAAAARRMGIALQYVNIARDIAVDAVMGRVYLPTTWLAEEGLTPLQLIELVTEPAVREPVARDLWQEQLRSVEKLRRRLLEKAFAIYAESRPTMNWLPDESRRPMIVAVESYMEIGRVLTESPAPLFKVKDKPSRATVPKSRRLMVALRALLEA